jgi:hypothetical protein
MVGSELIHHSRLIWPAAGSCERDGERSGSINDGDFFKYLSDYTFLRIYCMSI